MDTDEFIHWLFDQWDNGNLGEVAIAYQLADGTCGYHTEGSNYTNLALVTVLQHGLAAKLAVLRDAKGAN